MADETRFWPLKRGVPSDEELSKLADSIPHDWKRLGAALGLKEKYLNAIEMNKPNDVYERALAVLQKWKKRMGRKATYGRLAEALNDQLVRRPDLVKRYSRSNEIEDLEDNTIWKLKTGIPTDEELQRLAHDIPEDWKRIGRAVGLKEKHLRIIEIDKADDVCERALATLYKWKEKQGQEATYTRLALALDDSLVQRRDLVEEYCCDVFPKSAYFTSNQDDLDDVTDHPQRMDGYAGVEKIRPPRKSLPPTYLQAEEDITLARQQHLHKMKQEGSPNFNNFQKTLHKWKKRESFRGETTKEGTPSWRVRRSGVVTTTGDSHEVKQEIEEIRRELESAMERMDAVLHRVHNTPSKEASIPNERAADTIKPDTAAVPLTTAGLNAENTYDGERQNTDDGVFQEDQIERSNEFTRNTDQAKEDIDGSTNSLFDKFASESKTFTSFLWRWLVG